MNVWRAASLLGVLLLTLLMALGSYRAIAWDLGKDFAVFHTAWRLVLDGRIAEIYTYSPDRYLYAPGFALLFAPLGWIPKSAALALFSLLKAGAVYHLLALVRRRMAPELPLGVYAWGALCLGRPLMNDFYYGQVNTFIAWACVWALTRKRANSACAWSLAGLAAASKLLALPLLALPFFQAVRDGNAEGGSRRWKPVLAAVTGVCLILLPPFLYPGPGPAWLQLQAWQEALLARGFPLETHNQSFAALLHRLLGGAEFHVIFLEKSLRLTEPLLGAATLKVLAAAWTLGALLLILAACWLAAGKAGAEADPSAVKDQRLLPFLLPTLLILPSHLVWKAYFVFALPLAAALAARAVQAVQRKGAGAALPWGLGAVFCLVNLTGFDVLGVWLAARVESASVLLLGTLLLLALAARSLVQARRQPADA